MRIGGSGDEAISESHNCMDLTPADGSFAAKALFHSFPQVIELKLYTH